jgi:hypothetical protein
MRTLEILMVDGFVDIEQKDHCLALLQNLRLGEIDDASAVNEEEEFDLLIDL